MIGKPGPSLVCVNTLTLTLPGNLIPESDSRSGMSGRDLCLLEGKERGGYRVEGLGFSIGMQLPAQGEAGKDFPWRR